MAQSKPSWQEALAGLRTGFDDASQLPVEEPQDEAGQAVGKQQLCLSFQRRAGKPATIVTGFEGTPDQLADLAKELKVKLSVGGSVRDGELLLQGDVRKALRTYLQTKGWKVKGM